MNVTVILCTYNRSRYLQTVLTSLAASDVPETVRWEILVVDNNSNDETRMVVGDFQERYPRLFRYAFEPRPGKSYALNAAVREAWGDVLAFVDDDVTVEPTWLRNLVADLHGDKWSGAAGPIVLQWPCPLPRWLSIEGPYSRHPFPGFYQGQIGRELKGPPFGTNMAFRKVMFEKYGGFRTDLGPSPDRDVPPHSEDTEFGNRLIAGGEKLWYEPSAVVYHPIANERLSRHYFLSWWFDRGRAEIREFGTHGTFIGIALRLGAWIFRWTATLQPSVRFFRKLVVWQKAGQLVESYRIARRFAINRKPQ